MTGEVKRQGQESGLVERIWVRRSKRHGEMTERTREGQEVKATFLDREGRLRQASGKVIRNAAGQLSVESWSNGVRSETTVPRDANVDVTGRGR